MIGFSDRPVANIFKNMNHRKDIPTISKTKSLETHEDSRRDLNKYYADSHKANLKKLFVSYPRAG